MPVAQQKRCNATKADGTPCQARALPGKDACLFHDRASRKQTAEGRRQGGKSRSRPAAVLPADAPPLPLRTVADVIAAGEEVFNHVRTGRLDSRVGNCLAVLLSGQLRAIEGGELERRLQAIEARQAGGAGAAATNGSGHGNGHAGGNGHGRTNGKRYHR